MWNCRVLCGLLPLVALLLCGCPNDEAANQQKVTLPAWLTSDGAASAEVPESLRDAPAAAELTVTLNPGDQFPLRKVVQQELLQDSPTAIPQRNQSRLELLLAITVQDKQEGRTKLSVRYDRVKYEHQIADERISFDSTQATGEVPVGVRAYRDMVQDGFSFWIGPDNQIVQVEGLAEFLDRCLRNVPVEQRQDVVLGIEAGSGETGIANFVDNSIGLLPFGRPTAPGESWQRQQQVSRPVPLHINNTYTLKELTDQLAVIDIRGEISPSTTLNTLNGDNGLRVSVSGGSTTGSCTIFRDTGLPKESRVDRTIEMMVSMPNALQFRQTKRVVTTIEAYPATSGPPLMIGSAPNPGPVPGVNPGLMPAGGSVPVPAGNPGLTAPQALGTAAPAPTVVR